MSGLTIYDKSLRFNSTQNPVNHLKIFTTLLVSLFGLSFLSGCDSSSSNVDETGYVQFINAAKNSPNIRVTYTDSDGSDIVDAIPYGSASPLRNISSGDYDMVISWQESQDEFNDIFDGDIQVTDDRVDVVLISGDFSQPDLVYFEFDRDIDSLSDDDDEDQFSLQIINANQDSTGVDVYLSRENETFNEAQLVTNSIYQQISDVQRYDVESYKIYITATGSNAVVYESNTIDFNSNYQYLVVLREETGPSDSEYTVDVITNIFTSNFPDKESKTELRLFNGIIGHELLPEYTGVIDVNIDGTEESQSIEDLAIGTMSDTMIFSASDYSMDIIPNDLIEPIAENHFISLNPNDDKTVFLYLTEETEEVDDAPDETTVYVNSLIVENSNRVSLYDHEIKIINLVQDDDFDAIEVYFVRSNETVATADYKATASRASPRTVTLPNNTYDVSLIVQVNSSELLLDFQSITLDADSGDKYLIIEEDVESGSGYSMQLIGQ
ncbi:DUF4397 domain-containing protein [Aliikangiella marina]|uniref:DUF4397 domain-containing protein n=1 Tax=Aliikangiella marina TaxID=1712262 RepID=A0A545T905_9GAMM|nr:DUF4397 domain-containing protein [Aliikangiella marina]TQV73707.1 DUF4397 domain-containing protein [Aliikangiella marina]